MSKTAGSSNINNALIWIDRVSDYMPLASTVTNLVDITEKCIFKG